MYLKLPLHVLPSISRYFELDVLHSVHPLALHLVQSVCIPLQAGKKVVEI